VSVDGKRDNLEVATELAADLNVPHFYQKADYPEKTKDDLDGTARTADMLAGGKHMKTINCSEFVSATLAQSGWDLNAEYRDPTSGLAVGYLVGKRVQFVTNLAIININDAPTAAALAAQQTGGATRVVAGSDEAKQVGQGKRKEDFLLVAAAGSIGPGVAIDESLEFGAGAAAASLGGRPIERADRRPGDLQQFLKTTDGKADGHGHSSQVWSVRGPGIAWVEAGRAGCAELNGTPATPLAELEPGWYEVSGVDLSWELTPETDPALVATLAANSVKTIDANINRGEDATGLGEFDTERAYTKKGSSVAYSDGRLPTSKWFDWAPREGVEVRGHLTAATPEKKSPKKK
jgi:hypothetical protein